MQNAPHSEDYLDEIEQYLHDLPRPDERTFYLLLVELANMRAQMSVMTGILLDMYSTTKGRDFSKAAERLTKTLLDRQSAMRKQTIDDVRNLLERLRDREKREG